MNMMGMKIATKMTAEEKKELQDYILKVDTQGMTGFQKEMMGDMKKFIVSAYSTKTGGALLNRKEKQGETKAVKSLHKKLRNSLSKSVYSY